MTEKRGRSRTCRLGSEQLDEAAQWIDVYLRLWKGRMDRLGAYIDRRKGTERCATT